MLTIVILVLLTYGFLVGSRRGVALQLFYSIGYLISYVISATNYQKLSKSLELWVPFPNATRETKMVFFDQKTSFLLDKAFYAGVAFVFIFFISYLVVRLLGLFAHKLIKVKLFGNKNRPIAGILGVMSIYLSLFFLLTLASFVPTGQIQHLIGKSLMGKAMIERTPFFTKDIHRLWITNTIGKLK